MNNGQLANYLKLLIFKMSDSGSLKLNKWFSPQGEYVRDRAVREFSYLKAFLVSCLCQKASTQPGDAQMMMEMVTNLLGESWNRWSDQNYGCNVPEMLDHDSKYWDSCYEEIIYSHSFNSVTRLFINYIGEDNVRRANISFNEMSSFISSTYSNLEQSIQKKVSGGGGGCYIATCVYGSYDCPPVWVLRRFRDKFLNNFILGKLFIKIYYSVSPKIVYYFGENTVFKLTCKSILDKFIKLLQENGYSDTSYDDK